MHDDRPVTGSGSRRPDHDAEPAGGGLQAVLFDMDGTLCDSEPAWMAAEHVLAERTGAEWTEADAHHLVGADLLDAGAYIRQRMGLDDTPAQIVDQMLELVIEAVAREGVDWRPGALDLVEECNDAGIPTALVTMSYRNFAGAVVDALPRGRFDAVVTGDEVSAGKPAPDPYLAAAHALGVEASGCVAIEDSPTGAQSAYAAGCTVVVVPNHVSVSLAAGMVELRTLSGVSVEQLTGLLSQR